MAKKSVADIAPGQRYQEPNGYLWEVRRLITFRADGKLHVELVSVRESTTSKTLAAEVLIDKHRYTRVDP